MNINIKKENIKSSETLLTKESEVLSEADFIVPDSKPDIGKILEISGTPKISSCDTQADKVIINGTIEFTILYVPEGDDEAGVASLAHSQNFTDVCEAKGLKGDVSVRGESDISSIDFRLINSRKLSIKSVILVGITAYKEKELEVAVSAEGDFPIETKTKKLETYTVAADKDAEITAPDKFEMPADKPAVGEILKMDAEAIGYDVKIITGKAIVKGAVKLCILYQSPDSNLAAEYMEHEYPFTEIIDLPQVTENMDCAIRYKVLSVYYEIDPESSEIGVEVTLSAHVFATLPLSINYLHDCYSPDYELSPVKKDCMVDRIVQTNSVSVAARGTVTMPEDCPPVMRVYRVCTSPYVENVKVEEGSIIISGIVDTYVQYLTRAADTPMYSHRGEIEFTATVEACDYVEGSNIECDVKTENCSFVQSGEASVDVRANLLLNLKITRSEGVSVVDEIEVSELQTKPSKSITIYFVQQGDTMWDIAKRYRMPSDKICSANKINADESLKVGAALLIP